MSQETPRKIHEWFFESEVPQKVIENAGKYDGKYGTNVSLASHILNATVIGLNCYTYDKTFQRGESIEDEEDIRVLASALVLHDLNKYLNEKEGLPRDERRERNSQQALEEYFEDDEFGIEDFLGGDYFDDLFYLVQRTEIKEDTRESRGTKTEFRHLGRYCRLGDGAASEILNNGIRGGHEYLQSHYSTVDPNPVRLLGFTSIEQPILNDLLISSVKSVITGDYDGEIRGVVLGSTSDAVLYLGDEIDREWLMEAVEETVGSEATDQHDFSCKLNWNAFDYDILAEVAIRFEKKEGIISDEFVELLERGSAGVEPFESIPVDFQQYFPVLAKAMYIDGMTEFKDDSIQNIYDEIRDEQGAQKSKLHFIAHLLETYPEHEDFLNSLKDGLEPELQDDLEPDSDAIETAVRRFFGEDVEEELAPKGETCFLCGRSSSKKYQKGQSAFYSTQSYSRRVEPHAKYKKICEVCNLEYALLEDICEKSDVNLYNDVEVAYFYYDDFVGDIRLFPERASAFVQGETVEFDDPDVAAGLWEPQYHIQPFYVMNENHRMNLVRETMQKARDSGMKVVIGKPFSRFSSSSKVFEDEEAIRPEEVLELDEVERYEDLERPLALFDLMGSTGGTDNPYLELDRDELHTIANHTVVNVGAQLDVTIDYLKKYHGDSLMAMKQVAENGLELFGEQHDSKYKKTKVFRECIDSFLSGMSQGMDGDELVEHVAGQVYDASVREDYAGHVEHEDAVEFVESVKEYLEENELYDMKRLSDWEDALVNTYYLAYDQVLYGDNNGN